MKKKLNNEDKDEMGFHYTPISLRFTLQKECSA